MITKECLKRQNESEEMYIQRICELKGELNYSWQDVANLLNAQLNHNFTEAAYRSRYKKYMNTKLECPQSEQISLLDPEYTEEDELLALEERLVELKKEKWKLSDERTQVNALYRRMAREDTIKEIAKEAVSRLDESFKLPGFSIKGSTVDSSEEAILLLSDWHYGIEVNNFFNTYNPEIARRRIQKLGEEVLSILAERNINKMYVINLGDLISGRIHSTIRINNRIDVVTQCIEVSELLAEFMNEIARKGIKIEYHDTLDNHSRLEPNLKESLDLESMTRVINEFLRLRLKDTTNIRIVNNEYSDDMCNFLVCEEHNCIGVHGDKDKTKNMISKLTTFTKEPYELVVSAHLHHFSADEENNTIRISNGSLMGTDDYAMSLRVTSKPSQTLIIADQNTVSKCIYKLDLE